MTKKVIVYHICLVLLTTGAMAQETYDVISTTGVITNKKTGKVLQEGSQVTLQTEFQFSSLYDRAVLLGSSKTKHFLELPKSSFVNQQLTITSDQALSPVKNRPKLITGIRGSAALITDGVSAQTLKEYFGTDTFTVIGTELALPVTKLDAKKYGLLLRYENGNQVEECALSNFTVVKKGLKIQGNHIAECFVLLKDGEQIIPITQISLYFVDRIQLFREFDSLLKALNQKKTEKDLVGEILRQYCTDVYGNIDRTTLERAIDEYLAVNKNYLAS